MKNNNLPEKEPGNNKPLLKAIKGSEKTPLVLGSIEIPCYVLKKNKALVIPDSEGF